jgi:lipid A 3-O-deacylase
MSSTTCVRQWVYRCVTCAIWLGITCICGSLRAEPSRPLELQVGTGNHVDIVGLGIGTRDWFTHPLGTRWNASSYLLGRVAYWGSLDDHPAVSALYDFSLTPVLRLESGQGYAHFFFEIGVGLHVLSHTRINADRTFGSAFQFGEFAGPGLRFGDSGQFELGVVVQHISNGGIRNPNNGLTFGAAVFRYRSRNARVRRTDERDN